MNKHPSKSCLNTLFVFFWSLVFCFTAAAGCAQGLWDAGRMAAGAALPLQFPGGSRYGNVQGFAWPGLPTFYFGRLEHSTGSSWTLKRESASGTAQWPLKGFWLGAEKDVALDGRFGILVSGGIFLPQRSRGAWFESPPSRYYSFEIPHYEWWYLDGTVKASVSGPLELLLGFRWDHTSTKVDYSDNTRDGYILDSYIPLIGAQISRRFSSGSFLARVVGSPFVHGRLTYHFWEPTRLYEYGDFPLASKSSFLEFLADYRINCTRDLLVGGFAKWNLHSVRTREQNLSGIASEPVSWDVDIRSWTFGADVSLTFSSPL